MKGTFGAVFFLRRLQDEYCAEDNKYMFHRPGESF